MKIKNSLGTFIEQALLMNNNSIETVSKISDAVTSSEDTVTLTLTDPKDTTNTVEYSIPSFGYLKSEIDRLNNTINTMTNITDGSGSRVRLSDGTYRKIIASKIPSEAPTITTVDNITNFNFKSNWFFEDMLNPCLYVTWDLSNQISEETERVMIQRYILRCDTESKVKIFNDQLKGRNDISYSEFLTLLIKNGISYSLDDEVKDLPPRTKRYYGTFSVIRITTEKDLNGNSVKRYILDSLEFTDNKAGFENTRLLSVGDYVEVNSNPTTTRFKVIYVDVSECKIGLKCVEGAEGVSIGADTLKVSASQDTEVSADISVSFDEREVIFVKPIDPDSNIPANKWSPGVAFYTNELTYTDNNGTTQTLQKFYQKNVVDFGQVLLSYAYDYYPSIREAIVPEPPVLNYSNGTGDFKIVQINNQLTETTDSTTFRSLVADKLRVQSELNNIADEISKQKELIQTTQYTSTNEKLKAQSTLNSLVESQETLTSNYNSIVNNIKSKYESGSSATPKYRVRGFWDIPDSKISSSSGEQKIIKFKIRYRYLSESGNANKEEEFTYSSGGKTVTGRFSNWNEIETKTRPRVKTTNGWEWEDVNTSDPDAVNINQMDIPINSGEQVEIQVKSVSEAGWPANPVESDWSDSITVAFSDFAELQADDISELVSQNNVDAAVANVQQLYSGTAEHMSSSFYTNDKYFAHTAESITSGFLSSEQTPITLYDKLQDFQNQITAIIEQINGMNGDIDVVLVDGSDEEKTYTLNEGGTTYINAGNYLDAVKNIDEDKKKGAIITKTYYLDISTDAQSGLFLLSKLQGNRLSMCPNTIPDEKGELITSTPETSDYAGNDYDSYDNIVTPTTSSSTYYMEQGRYDLVPINLTNGENIDFQVDSINMYQSAQCRGQFVYSRFKNIGNTFDMYANTTENNKPKFDYKASFIDSECSSVYVESTDNIKDTDNDYYNYISDEGLINEYNSLTGSDINIETDGLSEEERQNIWKIINRLPKTYNKAATSTVKLLQNQKMLVRLNNTKSTTIADSADGKDLSTKMATTIQKYATRLNKINTSNTYSITPKIQTAYGFADLGNYVFDGNWDKDTNGVTYMTTHKIGYDTTRDRYAIGKDTCNSFLFLSPVNRSDIQVEGDTNNSTKGIKSGESLRVPIIYQYRMRDYTTTSEDNSKEDYGAIFGNTTLTASSAEVQNTKYANIIGIDIWTGVNDLTPKQYDIVVYSTYGSTVDTNSSKKKVSDQLLVNAGRQIARNLSGLVSDSKIVSSKTGSNITNISRTTTIKTLK